ncbi:DUF1800 domain-containing protein [Waterburya agarophytonicola K14]|uniref:DUF1800 domain-containing protein n=2 Tax=Waterburya TaxID=2886915 RepID=A0A964FHD2_9CYAN|nr:DUF1800 domain-containing protein [Waterburya agarophytonicola KI4]
MKQKLRCWAIILVCGAMFWFSSISNVQASDRLSQSDSEYILGRLSFGATSEQLQAVKTKGIEAYIQEQLEPQNVPESPAFTPYLEKFNSVYQKPLELQRQYAALNQQLKNNPNLSNSQIEKLEQKKNNLKQTARDSATEVHLARAVYSSRQLQEVMVDFWFNHFNVFVNKGAIHFWLSDYENKIRDRALGNFRDLLEATATSPAMLIYLDNELNTNPQSSSAKGKYSGLNENYARELMELHTLGIDGGYSQQDIITLARILTGWTVDYNGKRGNEDGFFFNSQRHDPGEKVFLDRQITAQGIEEGRQALDILASHPATAHFISYKLAQYFVADNPPANLVDSLAQKFLTSNGNIKVVMDALIHSPEFSSRDYQQKFKTPYQYLVSLVRMAEIDRPNFERMQGMLRQLSMPVYLCVPPTGYKNTQDAWLNPQAMLQRITFASAIANKRLNPDAEIEYPKLASNIGELSPQTKQAITQSPNLRTVLILGSPEAMYR